MSTLAHTRSAARASAFVVGVASSARLARLARLLPLLVVALVGAFGLTGCEQSMIARSSEAAAVLREFQTGDNQIPRDTLAQAQAIAILHETEAGVVVAGGGGKGVMVRRTQRGWSAPVALDSSTGSIGAQIGGQGRDIVMIFRNEMDIAKVLRQDGYAIADASATAGPANSAATSDNNTVLTFAKVAGLFAGARVGGVDFRINNQVNHETYGYQWSAEDILAGKVERPLGAGEIYTVLPPPK